MLMTATVAKSHYKARNINIHKNHQHNVFVNSPCIIQKDSVTVIALWSPENFLASNIILCQRIVHKIV